MQLCWQFFFPPFSVQYIRKYTKETHYSIWKVSVCYYCFLKYLLSVLYVLLNFNIIPFCNETFIFLEEKNSWHNRMWYYLQLTLAETGKFSLLLLWIVKLFCVSTNVPVQISGERIKDIHIWHMVNKDIQGYYIY